MLARTERVLPGIRPNVGIELAFRRRLNAMIDEMQASVVHWLRATYSRGPTTRLAMDAWPADVLQAAMKKLSARWLAKFDKMAVEMGEYFATAVEQRATGAMRRILKNAGWSVRFTMTPAMRNVLDATVHQSVGLIKSIPQQYLGQVEQLVMRSVQTGRDLETVAKGLQSQLGVTKRRAALIARDQNNKATAALTQARMIEAGIDEAVWVHSGAGKEPRPSHVKAGKDKVRFKLSQGWFDPHEKKYIQPGELINCFPGSTQVQFAENVEKAFRHWHSGELAEIVTSSGKTLRATPNHPVLTPNGWAAIGSLDEGDYVIQIANDGVSSAVVEAYDDKTVPSISQIFAALDVSSMREVALGGNFHGDVTNGNVDVVDTTRPLVFRFKTDSLQSLHDFVLAMTNKATFSSSLVEQFAYRGVRTASSFIGSFGELLSPALSYAGHAQAIGITGIAQCTASGDDASSYRTTRNRVFLGKGEYAYPSIMFPSESVRVVHVNRSAFDGHVFNLQTKAGWYVTEGIIAHNCRCVCKPVIKGF